MLRRFSINFAIFSVALDFVLVAGCLALATQLRPLLNLLPFGAKIYEPIYIPPLLYPIFAFLWVLILHLLVVYDGRRNFRVTDEVARLTFGAVLALISLAGTLYISYRDVSRLLFLAFVVLTYASQLSWRLLARLVFRLKSGRPAQQRRLLIVGAGPVGLQLQAQIENYSFLGLTVAGFLDDDPYKRGQANVLGTLDALRPVITLHHIDDVVIALPLRAYERINTLTADLHTLAVRVWIIPDYFHLALHKAVTDELAGIPMLDLRAPALNDFQRMAKRVFDLLFALILLPPAFVIMLLIAIAIRLEGPGPVFFRQERVGENGRIFGMIKFRTMIPNAEDLRHLVERYDEEGHLIHKSEDDPRVTRIGRFLRRSSLDELPQIFNILAGQMSWVGPRPELPYLVEKYEPWQRTRFAVPQGITGWWQINGRSDKPMHLNTQDDLYYVQNYSLLLDLQILIRTIGTVFRGKGAF